MIFNPIKKLLTHDYFKSSNHIIGTSCLCINSYISYDFLKQTSFIRLKIKWKDLVTMNDIETQKQENNMISFNDIKINIKNGLSIQRYDGSSVYLPHQMFCEFLQNIDDMNAAFQDIISGKKMVKYTCHLGDYFKVTLKEPYWILHISRWINDKKEQGISLKQKEWKIIYRILKKLDMSTYRPCYFDHENQLDYLNCKTCNVTNRSD